MSRGNHDSGAVIVRPSARSTVRAQSVRVTLCASASLISIPEVLMPFPPHHFRILIHQYFDSNEFLPSESAAMLQAHWIEPKLCHRAVPLHMNMRRLFSIGRVEEKSVWPR